MTNSVMFDERFESRVDRTTTPDGCHPWISTFFGDGYGSFWNGSRSIRAHRYSYELHVGPVPPGLMIRHSCDNPPCCNPAHLLPGTAKQNVEDMDQRGRRNPQRGEENHLTKVTAQNVIDIRRRYTGRGGITQRELGAEYGITQSAVSYILSGGCWTHV